MIAKLLIETDLENGQKGLAVSPKSWRHIADIAMEYRAAWSKASFLCRFQYKTAQCSSVKKMSVIWTKMAMGITQWFSRKKEVREYSQMHKYLRYHYGNDISS